ARLRVRRLHPRTDATLTRPGILVGCPFRVHSSMRCAGLVGNNMPVTTGAATPAPPRLACTQGRPRPPRPRALTFRRNLLADWFTGCEQIKFTFQEHRCPSE